MSERNGKKREEDPRLEHDHIVEPRTEGEGEEAKILGVERITEEEGSRRRAYERPEPVQGWKRGLWIALAIFSLFWIFFPEPTDLVPILGWLDEGVALFLLMTALSRLGIEIPYLDRLLLFFKKKI